MQYLIHETGDIVNMQELRKYMSPTILPRVPSNTTFANIGVSPILNVVKPKPSSNLYIVVLDGAIQNPHGEWLQNWIEIDRHTKIVGGLSKEKQDTTYMKESLKKSQSAKIKEIVREGTIRRNDIIDPNDYMYSILKTIKILNKKSKNNVSQSEIKEIDALEISVDKIEAINTAVDLMINEINSFTDIKDITSYPVSDNVGWPVPRKSKNN